MIQIEKWQRRRRDDGIVIKVTCPFCGIEYALDHEIAADGVVTPSLDCPTEDCDFHYIVQLVGWGSG